jgi:hypothetical protein
MRLQQPQPKKKFRIELYADKGLHEQQDFLSTDNDVPNDALRIRKNEKVTVTGWNYKEISRYFED